VLASRQLDLHQSEAELVAARERLDAIRARATAQRRVLEALLEERASLARGMEQP
jgi:septal ring factor EnvC (AmiA/AmiB activator)